MPSSPSRWETLIKNVAELPSEAVHLTPLSERAFRITDVQDDRILIEYRDEDETVALQREQFETLYERIQDTRNGFEFGRLPPNAEPYATVLSLYPRIEADTEERRLRGSEESVSSPLVDVDEEAVTSEESKSGESNGIIDEMLDNMGQPKDRVVCPIDGCQYSHRSAASVARHVSGSGTGTHIWANTDYAGWRDFVRKQE